MNASITSLFAAIEAAGIPALRVGFTLAFAIFVAGGVYIYRKRHTLFDRDRDVPNDFAGVRHVRLENILFVWGTLTVVLFCIFINVWMT